MIRLIQRKLIIPRGDTGSFNIPIIAAASESDVAVFTIFDCLTRAKIYQKIIEPSGDKLVIRFEHEDTVNLPIGKYFWDIKFYQNPVFIDEELVDGKEVDSYYAAFTVPECEVRQTGDNLLNADDAPDTTLSPESINFLEAVVNDANSAKQDAIESKDAAARSAQEAAGSADNASNYASLAEGYKNDAAGSAADALVSQGAAAGSASDASGSADAAAGSARDAADSASAAAGSASSAHDDAVAAANSKEAASRSAGLAENSASDAYRYSESANTDAGNAYNYATTAADSASAANRDAGAAAASALEASGYVNQITGLTATATQLASTASPTASYNSSTGILALGIPEGVGITSIVLNNDYTLTINLNNGQSITTTSIRGPQGPQGDAFHIVKTYASIAAMNADYSGTDVEIGEFVMIVSNVDDPDNAKVYVKGDQQYNFVVDMSGSTGIEGPEGKGINSVSITYQGGASNTSAPTGTWVDNPPSVAAGDYLWTRIIFTYTDSTTSAPFYSVAKQGDTGLRGSTWYNGTTITGTNTTPQIFVNSNITDAVVGDMYLNTETSNTYCCTLSGGATVAKWAYVNNIKGGQGDTGPVGSEYTVLVQSTQPTEESNKLWIPNGNNGITQEVPTVSEMNAALAGKADTFDIKVQDVQVNGTSIVNNGIANIPIAGENTIGAVKVAYGSQGLYVHDTTHQLIVSKASDANVKTGTEQMKPIVPYNQHESTFYGLAKAAGDSTQSASSNAVGTYTDGAKTAIQGMLNVADASAYGIVCPGTTAPQAITSGQYVIWQGSLYTATANIASGETLSTSTNLEAVTGGGLNALQQQIDAQKPGEWELVNDFTLTEESTIDLSADRNGMPYNFTSVWISVTYPANTPTASSGYGRYYVYGSNNVFMNAETSKYTTANYEKFKFLHLNRNGALSYLNYTLTASSGGNGYWNIKPGGMKLNFGNITKIQMASGDVEPAGTVIKIYGQWAR